MEAERQPSAAAGSRSAADAGGSQLPGRADGYPSGPPTDPYVRHSRIRFLTQSLCYPPQSTGVLVSGLVSAKSLPWFPPVGHSARRRLPARGSLGPRFLTFSGPMRRYDCHQAPLGSLRMALASRSRACFPRSWSPRRARCLVEAPRPRQGLGSPGPPLRAWRLETGGAPTFPRSPSADMPRSQTPVVSWALAAGAPRIAACRRMPTVGFCLDTAAAILLTTTLHIAGLNDAACLLAPSSFVRPLLGWHVEFATDLLARR